MLYAYLCHGMKTERIFADWSCLATGLFTAQTPNMAADQLAVIRAARAFTWTRNHTKPHQTTPNHTKPHQTTPNHNKPHQTTRTKPHHTKPHPNHIKPHQTTPNHTKPHQTTSNHTKPHQTTPNHTKPQQTTPNHTKPHQQMTSLPADSATSTNDEPTCRQHPRARAWYANSNTSRHLRITALFLTFIFPATVALFT